MKLTVHAGHNPDGKIACGAVGIIKESTEARKVCNRLVEILKASGHEVYNCTVNNGSSKATILSELNTNMNLVNADYNISIHFNDFVLSSANGVECWVYNQTTNAKPLAEAICSSIAKDGFKNRGVKFDSTLSILKNTKKPTILIECCFVKNVNDCKLYDFDIMAQAIAFAINSFK